jgi:hypothetical protein
VEEEKRNIRFRVGSLVGNVADFEVVDSVSQTALTGEDTGIFTERK